MKNLVKRLLHTAGWEVHRYRPYYSFEERLIALVRRCALELVIDVGANQGQYGARLRRGGYSGRIISFEALSSAHAVLARLAGRDNAWYVAPPMAISDRSGTLTLHVSRNSVSSSTLRPLPIHVQAAAGSETIGVEKVHAATLDEALAGTNLDKPALLKIDVQGAEDKVLAGASQTLSRVGAIQIELSLVPVYDRQLLAFDVMEKLRSHGFELADVNTEFVDPRDGRALQIDAVFLRPDVGNALQP